MQKYFKIVSFPLLWNRMRRRKCHKKDGFDRRNYKKKNTGEGYDILQWVGNISKENIEKEGSLGP